MRNENYYHIDVLDMKMQELNSHFPERTTYLLLGVGRLNPSDLFCSVDKKKTLRTTHLYLDDFDDLAIKGLARNLDTFIA